MDTLKVALVQTSLYWENPESNRAMLEEKLAGIHASDLVVLPEMFTTGFTMDTSLSEPHNFTTLKWMKLMARRMNAAITGSFIVKSEGHTYNRLYFITPEGTIEFYDKKHLFRMAGEDGRYSSGDRQLIVSYRGWRIALFICYDLRFPVWSRNRFENGSLMYDMAVYVANWPKARAKAWTTLLLARAMENSCYVCGVNRVGSDGNQVTYAGESMACGPRGDLLFKTVAEEEVVLTVELSKNLLAAYREKFPVHLDADDFIIKK